MMVMKRLHRTAALDGVDLFRRLDVVSDGSLVVDPERLDAVVEQLRIEIGETLSKPTSVRGWRAQAMFASLVVALDGCELMTFLDTGEVYYDGDNVKPADYFLALRDGRRIVVDVKDPGITTAKDMEKPIKLSDSEHRRLKRFADLYGAELFVACFIAAMASWVLLPIDAFIRQKNGSHTISPLRAFQVSEMGVLGDMAIGVIPPLRVVIHSDPLNPTFLDGGGSVKFAAGRTEFSTGAGVVDNPHEQEIVRFMIRFGSWELEQTAGADSAGSRIEKLVLTAEPPEDMPDQKWGIVGWLSQMYSRCFDAQTRNEEGITALDLASRPGMLSTLIPHDYDSEELPLLRLVQRSPGPEG
jgi:hypothetical protein